MDADAWNERYATADYVWREGPNVFVEEEVAPLPPGRALDLACGEGRNAVWLAQRGWTVTAVDFAAVGLDKGEQLAEARGVAVEWVCEDATTWAPADGDGGFDLVLVVYLQLPASGRRDALGAAARSLAPGGTLLVVAHDSANLAGGVGGPQDPAVLYGPEDVVADLEAVGAGLVVERAETVPREVEGADRPALDCLVRARR